MKCAICKESGFAPEEGIEYFGGFACESCSTKCAQCGDWLGNEPETIINGQRWHAMCAEDYAAEMQPNLPEAA